MTKKVFIIMVALAVVLPLFAASAFASVDEGRYYKYLKTVYEQKNSKLNDYLLDECGKFLTLFPTGSMAAEVRYVQGLIQVEKKNYPLAVASFLKGLYLDPVSDRMNEERDQIKRITGNEKRFRKYAEAIDRMTEGPFIEKNMPEKYFDYLKALYQINDPALYFAVVEETKFYSVNFPKSPKVEDVLTWGASTYKRGENFHEAIAAYQKIGELFPESGNIPENRLTVAKIRYMDLKDNERARDEFKAITENYPGKDVSGDAYFYLAELNEKKFKNPSEAATDYVTVASNYPSNKFAVEALFRAGQIYLHDMKDNERAIDVLNKVGRDFSGDARAPESYDRIAEIYSKNMKDYDSAITTYKKLAETYPQNPIAPERLYRAANIAENTLKDLGNALNLYEDLRGMFPDSKEAKKAQKKITSLKEKLKGQ